MTRTALSDTSAAVRTRPSILQELGAAVLAAVLVAIAVLLGYWQLDAWQARRAAEARDLTMLAPVPFTEVLGNDDPFPAPDVGRPVVLEGSWLPGGFWVSDREYDGRDGYWAVNPLQVPGPVPAAVLVVRGWSPEPNDSLLEVDGTSGEVTGWLQPPEGSMVPDDDPDSDVFPEIRVADAVQRVDVDLYSAYVVVDQPRSAQVAEGLETAELGSLPEAGRFTAVRNLLYAVEWWFFGAFAAFIWWRWRRDAHAPPDAG